MSKDKYQRLSPEATNEFQAMMKDLLFGPNGFVKNAPEEGKAAALDIINNTELAWLNRKGN